MLLPPLGPGPGQFEPKIANVNIGNTVVSKSMGGGIIIEQVESPGCTRKANPDFGTNNQLIGKPGYVVYWQTRKPGVYYYFSSTAGCNNKENIGEIHVDYT